MALEYNKKSADVVRHLCSKENYAHKSQLTGFVSHTDFMDWPKDSQKYNIYTNDRAVGAQGGEGGPATHPPPPSQLFAC